MPYYWALQEADFQIRDTISKALTLVKDVIWRMKAVL